MCIPLAGATGAVTMGTAGTFAVLSGSGITNTGHTTVGGDIGSFPTTSQTGFGPGADDVTQTGTNHHGDAVTQAAKSAVVTAYNDANNRTGPTPIAGGDLGGRTLGPGVYSDDGAPASLAITGTLTLNGTGDPGSIFVFQSASTLVTASASDVVLENGAQACHVFWKVTSSATLGTGSHLEGTVLALTSVTLDTGATVNGRALARNGAVTLHNNTILNVSCAPPPSTSPSPSTPSSIPYFPTLGGLLVAAAAGVGGSFVIVLKRR
ncbi:MAG: ice-binding family protein [Thermoplasmatota archaeon]